MNDGDSGVSRRPRKYELLIGWREGRGGYNGAIRRASFGISPESDSPLRRSRPIDLAIKNIELLRWLRVAVAFFTGKWKGGEGVAICAARGNNIVAA